MQIILSRYDELLGSSTHLDPLEDAITWISSLRSRAYTADVLRTVHGFASGSETNRLVRSIQTYAANALGLLDQAYSGPPAVSFLPLYYSVLNLSKITVIVAGLNSDLEKQKLHGTSYSTSSVSSHSLLTESVTMHRRGAFPLLYRALTGSRVGFKKRELQMRNVYPFLSGVTYEYIQAFSTSPARQSIVFGIENSGADKYRLTATVGQSEHPDAKKLRYLQAISGFRSKTGSPGIFVSSTVTATSASEAQEQLAQKVRRFLLYDLNVDALKNITSTDIPISSARIFMPEELPIWLALFHLSSVVRYNPNFLNRLEDSKYWPVLLSIRKHSLLRYLILFWSHMHQKTLLISVD